MLCVDYLRPAAIRAGVKLEEGQRFGFHNLRHSLASFWVTKKKTDVKTVQRSMRHATSSILLDHYAQTEMEELIAAQKLMLDAIFGESTTQYSSLPAGIDRRMDYKWDLLDGQRRPSR